MRLHADIIDEKIVVRDSDGGVWWPAAEATAEIDLANDPRAKAIEICDAEPMRGEWRQ